MSSQLPSLQPGRPATDLSVAIDPGLQPESEPRSMWRTIEQWYHRSPAIADMLIALGVVLLSLLTIFLAATEPDADPIATLHLPITLSALGIGGVALALRRRYPIWVWAVLLVIPEVYLFIQVHVYHLTDQQRSSMALGIGLIPILAMPICLGTLASHRRASIAWAAWAINAVVSTADIYFIAPHYSLLMLVKDIFITGLITAIGVLVGFNARNARLRIEALKARSARMALAGEQTALLAAAEERSRIAREMHDVVAHSLAVMITMADGAAATVERNPAVAKQAMETLAEAGRSALADTRRLVGVLREDPSVADGPTTDLIGSTDPEPAASSQSSEPSAASAASSSSAQSVHDHEVRDVPVPEFAPLGTVTPVEPSAPIASLRQQATHGGGDRSRGDLPLAPAPEQADITELVRRFEAAGVPVSYRWVGTALPEDKSLQLTVFRIAQEALTNVLRYAPTTPAVKVDVERHIGTVILTVDNEAAPGTRPMHGSGKGLIGMRERASVYGGTVQAGPTPTGWRVRAVLRWDEHDEGTSSWQMPL
ncbi:sensor histidine kinase [Actinomyces naeslundii]|uniref:sensor histidine kinase n=1 Tax=Actinomyces naeslundii TaxID=1655 RepID=UPI00094D0ED4|nr:histidine kinase [Actinomyces naeslundii]OLO85211.1 histidine kinase [Actinomyces naeslundii]OMG07268.1 histidine kinase [Actinomyces naeslundii]